MQLSTSEWKMSSVATVPTLQSRGQQWVFNLLLLKQMKKNTENYWKKYDSHTHTLLDLGHAGGTMSPRLYLYIGCCLHQQDMCWKTDGWIFIFKNSINSLDKMTLQFTNLPYDQRTYSFFLSFKVWLVCRATSWCCLSLSSTRSSVLRPTSS